MMTTLFKMMTLSAAHADWQTTTLSQRASETLAAGPWGSVGYMLFAMVAMVGFVALLALVLIYAERKVCAHFQCRLGPMRVGWHGVLQTVADTIKLLFKEDIVPAQSDKVLHLLA